MNPPNAVLLLVLVALAAYAVWVCYVLVLVTRSPAFGRSQKAGQIALALLLPVLGPAIVHWFVTAGTAAYQEPDREFIRQDIPAPGVTKVNW